MLGGSGEISLLLEDVEEEDEGMANTSRIKSDEIVDKISIAITSPIFFIVMPVQSGI